MVVFAPNKGKFVPHVKSVIHGGLTILMIKKKWVIFRRGAERTSGSGDAHAPRRREHEEVST